MEEERSMVATSTTRKKNWMWHILRDEGFIRYVMEEKLIRGRGTEVLDESLKGLMSCCRKEQRPVERKNCDKGEMSVKSKNVNSCCIVYLK